MNSAISKILLSCKVFHRCCHEARSLKEHSAMMFAKTPFSEHVINPVLASLFGPHSVGIFAIENPSNNTAPTLLTIHP